MGHPLGASAGYYRAPPARRRRRWPWVLLVVVVVLAGLFVVADRLALAAAEDRAASTLQTSQHLPLEPDVSISGFPFLTQLLSREFDDVRVSASAVEIGGLRTLRIAELVVHLHGVTVRSDYSSVRAATALADARITYADLSQTLGVAVSDGGNGRLVASPSVTILGQEFSAQLSAIVRASSVTGITFDDVHVSSGGVSLPGAVTDSLGAVFTTAISLAGLPFGVHATGIEVTSSGLVLHMSGSDLVYNRK